jgi:predicted acylesterase/phospholipase RssA
MTISLEDAQREAWDIVRGTGATDVGRVRKLEKVLSNARQFGLARKMLNRCVKDDPAFRSGQDIRLKIAQRRALCTYKDMDLPADQKLHDALAILREADDLEKTECQETLGQAGAIYKRLWELSAQQRDLEISLAYYHRGYELGVAGDFGYTAINAAFVLDLLAGIETVAVQSPAGSAERRHSLASEIRRAIVAKVPGLAAIPGNEGLSTTWWFLVTIGEAYFGLDDYANAEAWLMRAAELPNVPDWEQESTARQLATLLRIKQNLKNRAAPGVTAAAGEVLLKFLGKNVAAAESVLRGKVGLALSGGGFRASLYHIGVFAKLAELDLLRHIEYLSCVSGGSIVGAHFYLEMRKLLHAKLDDEITQQDYIDIVERLAEDFYAGVRTNIRTRIAAEWLTNLKMIFLPGYSRTMRAGELYEKHIYSRVDDGDGKRPRWLNELKIVPKGESEAFSPKDNNWRRAAKVPILVLNATSLNTGHNWQFTATWMGEPPAGIDTEVDANYRLRRMYYKDAPPKHRRIRLGHAVGASASVPGLFEPLTLLDLYERGPPAVDSKVRPVVRLVDGGVFDNQGISALLEQGCSVLLVSDASGQMEDRDFPANGMLGVPLRANSILQSRVRVSQFEALAGRRQGGLLKGLMFIHLKKDLETTPVDWIDSQEPSERRTLLPLTRYGVQRHVQRQLAAIRTDLDSFSEAEAYALMTSGYLMSEWVLRERILGFDVHASARRPWKFLEIEPFMTEGGQDTSLVGQLKVARSIAFKVWRLMRELQILAGTLVVSLLGLLIYAAYTWWRGNVVSLTVGDLAVLVLTTALSLLGLGFVAKLVNYRKTATEILIGIGMATVGFLVARLHLHVFDKLFLWQGSLSALRRRERRASAGA